MKTTLGMLLDFNMSSSSNSNQLSSLNDNYFMPVIINFSALNICTAFNNKNNVGFFIRIVNKIQRYMMIYILEFQILYLHII